MAKSNQVVDAAVPGVKLGFWSLFGFATTGDLVLLVLACLFAFCEGALVPIAYIIFGDLTDTFVDVGHIAKCQNPEIECSDDSDLTCWREKLQACLTDGEDWREEVKEILELFLNFNLLDELSSYAVQFSYFAVACWLAGWISTAISMSKAADQAKRIKTAYYHGLLRQDIGFYDVEEAAVLSQRMTGDIKKIQDAVGEKLTSTVKCMGQFIGGISLGLVYNYKFSLVLLSTMPVIAVAGIFLFTVETRVEMAKKKSYASAHAIAEEVFAGIRTVTSFNKQQQESDRYKKHLAESKRTGIKYAPIRGLGLGILPFTLYGIFALGFWYGGKLIVEEDWNVGEMFTCLLAVFIGTFALSLVGTNVDYFTQGIAAATDVYSIIDRAPPIDKDSTAGVKCGDDFKPEIRFKNVHFRYPTRQEDIILDGFTLNVKQGQTVALVGESGSGKSTVVKLIQRYYEHGDGEITISNHDIRDIRLKSLRSRIGVVNQEPILFNMTVRENILMGKLNATDKEIINAAKLANEKVTYDFISKLPRGFDSPCGQSGSLLSGGQKQRVCIARALVKNPDILLLDEATSALDTQSEKIVQQALENASKNRTTILIAHRLATVKSADLIVAVQKGKAIEQGTWDELIQKDGYFASLVAISSVESGPDDTTQHVDKETKNQEVTLTGQVRCADDQVETNFDEYEAGFFDLMRLNRPETGYIILGCFSALVVGAVEPFFAISMADFIKAFSAYEYGSQELDDEIFKWSMFALAIGVALLLFDTLEYACLGKAGEELTMRLREMSFRSMIDQDIGYFDDPANPVGALCDRLANDAANVQSVTGVRVANVLKNFMTLLVALFIGFYYCWEVALVALSFIPIIGIANMLQLRQLSGTGADNTKAAFEQAQNQVTESIRNIRAVTSLQCEEKLESAFVANITKPIETQKHNAHFVGVVMGMTDSVLFFSYALCFWFGGYLIDIERYTLDEFEVIYKAIMGVIFGAIVLGQNASFMPNFAEASVSANRLFTLFNRKSKISPFNAAGIRPGKCHSELVFSQSVFAYPTRPNIKVLNSFNMKIEPGKTIAVVGQSGQGKSTVIQLIERFYDINGGSVKLDGHELRDLDVNWLRSQIGLVSQEPVLFNMSIRDNIRYGANDDDVTDVDIVNAAKQANAHKFISQLEHGYDTLCGSGGSQLSGGQKQRVPIARTLIRNPAVLLLDEATSALDNESEKIVQDALDRARADRTCIVVAHRLSTIKNADVICVLHEGKIIEVGAHENLLKARGAYYELVRQQI